MSTGDSAGPEAAPANGDGSLPLREVRASAPPSDPGGRTSGLAPTVDLSSGDDGVAVTEAQPPSRRPLLTASDSWRYELQEEIGRGGMGVVYRARQLELDRPVAIKMILAGQLATAEQIEVLRAEARAAATVRHPNVVGVYESGQVQGWHYIAMELVEGESLAGSFASAPMSPADVVRLLLSVTRAVAHLHDHGILHQDLKPGNILIDGSGTPYVTDFGLAKAFLRDPNQAQIQGQVMGTPAYMAPEQARGHHDEISIASDVYSLGAVMYDLLIGRPPFFASTPAETLLQVVRQDPVPPRKLRHEIPAELESVCLKCLEKNPGRRYPSAHLLAGDLERILQGEPVDAQPLKLLQRTHRWMRREPALALRWLALALLIGIEQIWYPLGVTTRSYHLAVMGIVPTMALVSYALNQLTRRARWSQAARLAWAGMDVALLTVLLLLSQHSIFGPMLVCYPVYIAASGLWYRARLVVAAWGFSVVSYLTLLVEARRFRPEIVPTFDVPIVHLAGLAVLALIVYFMVVRIRVLARYLEMR